MRNTFRSRALEGQTPELLPTAPERERFASRKQRAAVRAGVHSQQSSEKLGWLPRRLRFSVEGVEGVEIGSSAPQLHIESYQNRSVARLVE